MSKFNLTDEDWAALNDAKEKAKAPAFKSSGQVINFRDINFVMRPAGQKPYTYILQHNDLTVKIAQQVSRGRFPEIFIEFRSQLLWRFSHRHAYLFIKEWISTWAVVVNDVVSRADLAIDLSGCLDVGIENVISRVRKGKVYLQFLPIKEGEIYHYGSKVTGWTFGSGPLVMRIYDKLSESKISHKEWFHDLWKEGGWDEKSDVTRVEIQMRRDFLKEFEVGTFESFEKSLGDIFRYVTEDWFSLREPSTDKNRSRWPVTPLWSEVQGAIKDFGKTHGQIRGRIKEGKRNVLIPQAAGLITSIGATDEHFTLENFLFEVRRHYRKKGLTIEEAISEKRQRNNIFEDGYEPF